MNDYDAFTEKIWENAPGLGKLTINGKKLEECDNSVLDVRTGSLEEHVALQPSGIVWIGWACSHKEHLLRVKRAEYEVWKRITMSDVKDEMKRKCLATKPPTIQDVENAFAKLYKDEILKRETEISALTADVDMLKAYANAWKDKSYALKHFIEVRDDEKYAPNFQR